VEKCCHFWDLMRRIVGPNSQALRVFASGGMDVNHKEEVYRNAESNNIEVPDIIDNAFVVVEFAGGVRCCLDLCMFAEDRQHEEVSVVGSLGKVHAEAPACIVSHHTPSQRASGAKASKNRKPPLPGTYEANTVVTQTHVDPKLLEAGFHEGATFYELSAFFDAVSEPPPNTHPPHHAFLFLFIISLCLFTRYCALKTKQNKDIPTLLSEIVYCVFNNNISNQTTNHFQIREGRPATVTVDDGFAAVAIGIAAELSIKESRLVQMSEIMGTENMTEVENSKRQKCE
jgi:hypothetical protein